MSASDAAPLPRLGEVFFDVRGNSRSMRLSWYGDTGVAVFSIWQNGTCTGTFRLPIGELPRMAEALRRGPEPSDEHVGWADQGDRPAEADRAAQRDLADEPPGQPVWPEQRAWPEQPDWPEWRDWPDQPDRVGPDTVRWPGETGARTADLADPYEPGGRMASSHLPDDRPADYPADPPASYPPPPADNQADPITPVYPHRAAPGYGAAGYYGRAFPGRYADSDEITYHEASGQATRTYPADEDSIGDGGRPAAFPPAPSGRR